MMTEIREQSNMQYGAHVLKGSFNGKLILNGKLQEQFLWTTK